jgi:hypothetical protein
MEQAEQQLPTFDKISQNMATAAVILDTLPAPSTNGVGEMYRQLESILGTTTAQQAESSLQHRVEASILPPTPRHPMDWEKWAPKELWTWERLPHRHIF